MDNRDLMDFILLEDTYNKAVYDDIHDFICSMHLDPDMTNALLDAIYKVLLG